MFFIVSSRIRKTQYHTIDDIWDDCYQNALAKRINGILKGEFLIHKCNRAKDLKKLIDESIITYNNKRLHLSLNYKTSNFIHNKKSSEASFAGLI